MSGRVTTAGVGGEGLASMTTLYGIANCDTVRRARRWLDARGIDYRFHDLRAEGLDAELLRAWAAELGWQVLLNRQSSTWRQLAAEARDGLDEDRAVGLLATHPLLIKRPVLEVEGRRHVGFSEKLYASLFAGKLTADSCQPSAVSNPSRAES